MAAQTCLTLIIAYAVAFIGVWGLMRWEKWRDQRKQPKQKRR